MPMLHVAEGAPVALTVPPLTVISASSVAMPALVPHSPVTLPPVAVTLPPLIVISPGVLYRPALMMSLPSPVPPVAMIMPPLTVMAPAEMPALTASLSDTAVPVAVRLPIWSPVLWA